MREQVGVIGVDAGLCWVGDPCYFVQNQPPKNLTAFGEVVSSWTHFCEQLDFTAGPVAKQFNYAFGHPGLGVCVGTGYGDGEYPVYVTRNAEGRIASVTVEFIGPDGVLE